MGVGRQRLPNGRERGLKSGLPSACHTFVSKPDKILPLAQSQEEEASMSEEHCKGEESHHWCLMLNAAPVFVPLGWPPSPLLCSCSEAVYHLQSAGPPLIEARTDLTYSNIWMAQL